ncbi:MAG: hypothetical protein K2M46_08855 [Lachnospiraceae bacterium]|nr:hypothetical protein [Lachnospiraceae bacterium]
MKKYYEKNLVNIWCNCCGKELKLENEIVKEGVFSGDINWSFFSGKDGEHHSFDLCENCYDRIVKEFKLPVSVRENTELV